MSNRRGRRAARTFKAAHVSQRLRIGYIVPQFPGQTHDVFWREIHALEAMGHDVYIFTPRKPAKTQIAQDWTAQAASRTTVLSTFNPISPLVALSRLLSKGLLRWALREGPAFLRDSLTALGAAQHLAKCARHHRLDHIHVHSCGRAALIAYLAHHLGAPRYSLTQHLPLAHSGSAQRLKWGQAGFVTAVTHRLLTEASNALPESLPDRILVRPMGVDTTHYLRSAPYMPPEAGRPLQVFSCGQFTDGAGHEDLLSATRQLLDQGVDVRVEIAGTGDTASGSTRETLEAQIKKLRLSEHVKLLGALKSGTIKAKLDDAHLFVLVPRNDHLSVAYMEAMAMGVPTLGADTGGVRELIEDSVTGYLVEPRNPGMLSRTIRSLANDPDALLRLSDAGRTHIETYYKSEHTAQTLVSEIQRLKSEATAS